MRKYSPTLHLGPCKSTLQGFPRESVDLIVTSPPYWNQREYSHWPKYADYIQSVLGWVGECARVLKPGRHCFWVIPDNLPWPPKENGTRERLYMPIYADTERIAAMHGLVCEFPIVWVKTHGTQKMFGSYPYPPTTIHTQKTERICVWRKQGKPNLSRKSDESKYTKEQWSQWGVDVWEISAARDKVHPAVFPLEIPRRIITLWSFVDDIVLDPFMGSGTTGLACIELDRNFIGIERNIDYYKHAKSRLDAAEIEAAQARLTAIVFSQGGE